MSDLIKFISSLFLSIPVRTTKGSSLPLKHRPWLIITESIRVSHRGLLTLWVLSDISNELSTGVREREVSLVKYSYHRACLECRRPRLR